MGFFGFLFWMVVIWLAFRAFRSWGACSGSSRSYDWSGGRETRQDRDSYVDALETRVAELEERLDFTERLVSSKREIAS
jgi:hypothetical protein